MTAILEAKADGISALPPLEYAERFVTFAWHEALQLADDEIAEASSRPVWGTFRQHNAGKIRNGGPPVGVGSTDGNERRGLSRQRRVTPLALALAVLRSVLAEEANE